MSFESPISVLYNADGNEIALSQSQVINNASQPGLVMAGSGSDGRAYFFRVSNAGELFITGSIATTSAVSASIIVGGWQRDVTGSMKVDGWGLTVTGNMNLAAWGTNVTGTVNLVPSASIIVGGWQSGVTASTIVGGFAAGVSGTNIIGGWAQLVTASTREIGASTTTVSAAISSLTSFILLSATPGRTRAAFFKEGGGICYIKLGAVASATSYTVALTANGYYELPDNYTGRVDIIFSTIPASSILRVTEIVIP